MRYTSLRVNLERKKHLEEIALEESIKQKRIIKWTEIANELFDRAISDLEGVKNGKTYQNDTRVHY